MTSRTPSIRLAFAAFLAFHGLVHLLGFVVPWQLATTPDFAYTTTAAWGALDLGDTGARAVGLVMLALAIAYPVAAFGVWHATRWALPAVIAATLVSVVVTILQAPAAVLGLLLNVGILAALVVDRASGDPVRVARPAGER
ncbi:MAG: ABC transporter permease [Candidatus Limnocylindrales bacterium]